MKPAPFKYFAPTTQDETLSLLAEYGYEATLLAGGQSLIPTMNFRLAQPEILIDMNRIAGLDYILLDNAGTLHIGAMTRQRTAERSALILQNAPLLHKALPFVAHPPIRNRGTIGGSIAHADPSAEIPAVMVALGARFRLQSLHKERWVPAAAFFDGWFSTVREPEELLAEIEVPALPSYSGCAFDEVARRHGDYALVGVAAQVTLDEKGQCEQAQIVLMSVGAGPVQAVQASQMLIGTSPTTKTIRAAAEIVASQDIDPSDSIHASAGYKHHLAQTLTIRTLTQAFEEAQLE